MVNKASALDDPAQANALVAQVERSLAAPPDEVPDPTLYELPDTHVVLPGGYLTFEGSVITDAEVRELTGEDEEALSRLTSPGKMLVAILDRAVVKVGDKKPDRSILDGLLSGDRDMLLLAIRRATFGEDVSYTTTCDLCGEVSEFRIDLRKDVPVRALEDQSQRSFTVKCRAGEVEVALPSGATQRELMQSSDKTIAEINTLLLGGCVVSVDGMPSMGVGTVKRLGIMDRERITKEIGERVPGPRLNEVKKECAKCGGEATLQLSLASLFLL